MVIVIVLWEVIDPEAVPFVDPWRKQEGKDVVAVPGGHSFAHSLQTRSLHVCWALGRSWARREGKGSGVAVGRCPEGDRVVYGERTHHQ